MYKLPFSLCKYFMLNLIDPTTTVSLPHEDIYCAHTTFQTIHLYILSRFSIHLGNNTRIPEYSENTTRNVYPTCSSTIPPRNSSLLPESTLAHFNKPEILPFHPHCGFLGIPAAFCPRSRLDDTP